VTTILYKTLMCYANPFSLKTLKSSHFNISLWGMNISLSP